MGFIKLTFLALLVATIYGCCSKSIEGVDVSASSSAERSAYHQFMSGCRKLSSKQSNHALAKELLVVVLEEIPSSGYIWHYQVSGPVSVSLVQESVVEGNSPGVYGEPQKHLWKFQCQDSGEGKIVFKKYRPFIGEESTVEEFTYNIKIKS